MSQAELTILELFQQWAELQPDRCKALKTRTGELIPGVFYLSDAQLSVGSRAANILDLATLQACLQRAIASHNARLRLENAADGWHVEILDPTTGIGSISSNEEPAIAILQAWCEFLKKGAIAPQEIA